jgi:hypothetical protein
MIGGSRLYAMDPVVSVQTLLLRAQMPELTLRPGASVMARVASRGEDHGVLVLAGIPLTAQLPDDVQAGATLKLLVQEVTPERVVLRLDASAVPGQAPAPQQASPRVSVQEPPRRRASASGEETASVALSFDSPALGRLDLRIDLATGGVQAAIAAPAGRAYEAADAGTERLRARLTEATGRPASVRVTPRREPLDLYA